ncbi:MAG: capsular polysaccharide synthesis protein [Erythrobacter sp.]|uniref:capsular polysaccharide synthesis protein n=1 Tax=Erythrobacter sp. TaxID=1042 RepID=UPI003C7710CC
MAELAAIPRDNPLNRWRHRRFVGAQHRRDRARRQTLGFHTFGPDWEALMARPAPTDTRVERTVWMLWLQGETAAPPLVRHCIDTWRNHNPDWTIRVLDKDSVGAFIDLPPMPKTAKPNHIANLIRLRLLTRYGGVWTDATTLCRQPLDDWIDRAAQTGFFAFARPQPVRALANWFIAAQTGHPLLEGWRSWSETYLLSGRRPQSYFWSHHTFDWLLRASPCLAREWRDVPKVSARGPHILQRVLDADVTPGGTRFSGTFAQVPLFKLNWKKGYTPDAVEAAIARGMQA